MQTNKDLSGNGASPTDLIPIEAEGFHAYADAFALTDEWIVFLSIAGHKDAVKAVRARLLTNHWIKVAMHEICLLPGKKYGTIVRNLPSGISHAAIFMTHEPGDPQVHYALTAEPRHLDADLYFSTVMTHSAVPIHSGWKTWLGKRAVQRKEVEVLTAHGIHGIKITLDDESLAADISTALKKGKLKAIFDDTSLLSFSKTSRRV